MTDSKKTPAPPTLKAVRGTRDLLPDQTPLWNHVESTARALFARYGFGEIRTPIFETTELFARGVGEETDIVSKEMFTWEDRARAASEKAQSLTLRPESTAGVVRAYIEHKLGETGQLQKLYYIGPQFRRERPQRGRYRQFWQIGAEVIGPQSSGSESPLRDAEILEMLASLLDELGIRDWRLELNSVGSSEDRIRYNAALREALAPIKHQLCPDNQRRAETNPLRVLDSKDEADQDPHQRPAQDRRLPRPRLARPLHSGSSRTRRLQRALQPKPASRPRPRLLHPHHLRVHRNHRPGHPERPPRRRPLRRPKRDARRPQGPRHRLRHRRRPPNPNPPGPAEADGISTAPAKLDAYIAPLTPAQNPAALSLARDLRTSGLTVEVGDGTFKLRKSFDIADTLARHILLLGEDEVATGTATVKTFATSEQTKVPYRDLPAKLR